MELALTGRPWRRRAWPSWVWSTDSRAGQALTVAIELANEVLAAFTRREGEQAIVRRV
jgi:hypothetical protein